MQLLHWLPPAAKGGKKAVTTTPVRAVRNVRREDAERRAADAGETPQAPSTTPSTFAP